MISTRKSVNEFKVSTDKAVSPVSKTGTLKELDKAKASETNNSRRKHLMSKLKKFYSKLIAITLLNEVQEIS